MQMSPEQMILRAREAETIINSEIYQQAWEQIESELMKQWSESKKHDIKEREHVYMMISIKNQLKDALESTLNSGKLAASNLEYQKSLKERISSYF